MPTKSGKLETTATFTQSELMLRALKAKEEALLEKMERIKTFPREEQALLAGRTQATLDGVREEMKKYAQPTTQ